MDSDLQHPPSVIPLLLAEFEKGNDIVYTIRTSSRDVGFFTKLASRIFYWCINQISDTPIHENVSDFRLLSRRVITVFRDQVRERSLFLRGIVNWIGYRQAGVAFTAAERAAGKTTYSLRRRIQLALSGAISFSRKPLRAAAFTGLIFAVFGFAFAVITVVQYLLGQIPPSGFSAIVVLICMFGGIQLIFLGVVGEYIGAIFDEVKTRPLYLVDETIGIEPHSHG
jgi:dolichol-phosphate mannosyltransferase